MVTKTAEVKIGLQRIYIKDSAFESPDTPQAASNSLDPQVEFTMSCRSRRLENNEYEVVLQIAVKVTKSGDLVFLAEIQQAGLFEIDGINENALEQVLNITCPKVLFPYGREAIDALIIKGGFPPVLIANVNFEAAYAQGKKAQV